MGFLDDLTAPLAKVPVVGPVAHRLLRLLDPPVAVTAAETPRVLMAQLLSASMATNTATGREQYYTAVLRQLVPDEARIIATLAEGVTSPLVSIFRRGGAEPVLENASLIGRTAAVTLPSLTPRYVTHLLDLGLVEIGPEDREAAQGYELVLAERDVRDALKDGELGKVPPRVQRRTLRLSALGRDLWDASHPGEDPR